MTAAAVHPLASDPVTPDRPATPTSPAAATSAPSAHLPATAGTGTVDVEIVIPVYNEERDLAPSVQRLVAYARTALPWSVRVTIADNASTDGTWALAQSLADTVEEVEALHLDAKGRGRALHAAWSRSTARVVAYMDVDLSTDLAALPPLLAPLLSGHSDVAIGTRLSYSSRVVRGSKREVISRCYNALLHAALRTRFSDAQCGFKAIRADRARTLLPLVADTGWFFDTELLVLAERAGLRIHEVPVDWVDDPDSRVDILSTAVADLRGVLRVGAGLALGRIPLEQVGGRRRSATGRQVARFAGIGVLSTLAYLVLYLGLRQGMSAFAANAVALLVTAVANTAANRRLTFGVRGREGAVRHQLQGLGVFGVGLAVTTGSLGLLRLADPRPGLATEATVLVAANVLATVMRFLLLRGWVFRR